MIIVLFLFVMSGLLTGMNESIIKDKHGQKEKTSKIVERNSKQKFMLENENNRFFISNPDSAQHDDFRLAKRQGQ